MIGALTGENGGTCIAFFACAAALWAQPPAPSGESLYAARCAACHGKDLRGGEAPGLHRSRVVVSAPQRRLFEVLKNGIPGTEMAPVSLPDAQIESIVRYVHSRTRPGLGPPVAGDVNAGRGLFATAGCARCHIVEGKGGVLGPALSSIALQLTTAQIREALLEPNARIAENYAAAIVITTHGGRHEGTIKNEDNFSVQMMTVAGELLSVPRTSIASLETPGRSLMPPLQLSPAELQNLLAFLDRQRAPFVHTQVGFQTY
jgi:putative heme-binding domain-containing protein